MTDPLMRFDCAQSGDGPCMLRRDDGAWVRYDDAAASERRAQLCIKACDGISDETLETITPLHAVKRYSEAKAKADATGTELGVLYILFAWECGHITAHQAAELFGVSMEQAQHLRSTAVDVSLGAVKCISADTE
jgi:hypothetical protein